MCRRRFQDRMKTTEYFKYTRRRPDRVYIKDEWIQQAIDSPIAEKIQTDSRIRRWTWVPEEGKFLSVILLEDQQTVHNAFFDRSFRTGANPNED
jgi:hypothetical protein